MAQAEQFTLETIAPNEFAYGVAPKVPAITRVDEEMLQISVQSNMVTVAALEITADNVQIRAYKRQTFSSKKEYRDQFVPLDSETVPSDKMADLLAAYDQVAQSGTQPLATAQSRKMVVDAIAYIEANRIEARMSFDKWPGGDIELVLNDYQKGRKLHQIVIRNGNEMSIFARRGTKIDRARPAVALAIKAAEFMFDEVDTDALWARYEFLRNEVAQEIDAKRAKSKVESVAKDEILEGDLLILKSPASYQTYGTVQVVFAHWKQTRTRATLQGRFVDENGNSANLRLNQRDMKGVRKLSSDNINLISSRVHSAHEILGFMMKQREIEARRAADRKAHKAMVEHLTA